MRILNALSYYRPHYSGLTVYTERLARALTGRGHEVTVLTSRYDRSLSLEEQMDGVRVKRIPVAFKISKGPIMPAFPGWAIRLLAQNDVLHLHVPQLDAAPLALLGRWMGKPVVLTYHCDLCGANNRIENQCGCDPDNMAAKACRPDDLVSK